MCNLLEKWEIGQDMDESDLRWEARLEIWVVDSLGEKCG